MATRPIIKTFKLDNVLTNVTTAKLSDPTGAYGLKRNDLSASTVSGGTLANPVVITTSAAHGISDGQMVNFLSMVGMTDLEGLNYYAKVTGYSTTTFGLYQETGLTNTVDGSAFAGAATGGTATPVEVADGTAMTNSATGTYTYSFTDAVSLAYTAYVEFVYAGATLHFEVDLPARSATDDTAFDFTEIKVILADQLGWGRNTEGAGSDWSTETVARLDGIIESGHLQFIYPPVVDGETVAHRWTFLRPKTTLSTVASTYLYDMPATYGSMVGDMSYDADEDEHRIIEHTSPAVIDRKRAIDDAEGRPDCFALRPKSVGQTTAQVTELMFYPTPDAAYDIVYYYDAKVYPPSTVRSILLGGQAHSETILQSCRDIAAARYRDDPAGLEHSLFLERLRASIEADRRNSPKTLGINDDGRRITHTRHGTEFAVSLTHNLGGG